MIIAGLTGPYCAGKNYLAALLENRGIPVLDVDVLGHQALQTRIEEISAVFGTAFVTGGGTQKQIDRHALGRIVFGNTAALERLESIVHPEVDRLIAQWLASPSPDAARIINAALLHKTAAAGQLCYVIVVTAPFWLRLLRAKKRDHLTFREIFQRFAAQKNFLRRFIPPNAAVVRIKNNGWGLFPALEHRHLEKSLERALKVMGISG